MKTPRETPAETKLRGLCELAFAAVANVEFPFGRLTAAHVAERERLEAQLGKTYDVCNQRWVANNG